VQEIKIEAKMIYPRMEQPALGIIRNVYLEFQLWKRWKEEVYRLLQT